MQKNPEESLKLWHMGTYMRVPSNEYQHDRVWMVFKGLGLLVLWTKLALALVGLTLPMLTMLRLLSSKAQ